MSNKSYRINTTAGGSDKYIKVKLEQDVDSIDILSLNIKQKDIYSSFNSNFGVLIGRVIANGGVGIANAKISVFIPISEEDKLNPDITAIYPFETPRDKNVDGVRYNLLPRVAVNNPFIGESEYAPNVPVGTFPTKEEICVNPAYNETYKKYYKYTTVSNQSGDYMIYGVPIGIQTVHMSVDVTDIGKFSMKPATMITELGYSPSLFNEDGTKIKYTTDLETLPNVETQEVSVDIKPFWGDSENYEIGITRQDFKIRAVLVGNFIVFGSTFTDGEFAVWADSYESGQNPQEQEFYRINNVVFPGITGATPQFNVSIASKRTTDEIVENIFYYPNSIDDDAITSGTVNTGRDIAVLGKQQYRKYSENGQFAFVISCNRKRMITNEFGDLVDAPENSSEGIFTEFKGFMTFEYDGLPIDPSGELDGRPIRQIRNRFKFPQYGLEGDSFRRNENAAAEEDNEAWRKQHYTFTYGGLYSVAKYHHLHFNGSGSGVLDDLDRDSYNNVGIIVTDDSLYVGNTTYQFPFNGVDANNYDSFGAQWLNFCIHFPQHGYVNRDNGDRRTNQQWTFNHDHEYYTHDNNQLIGAYVKNTIGYSRNDRNWTTFVIVDKDDVNNILDNITSKGFKSSEITGFSLKGIYANGGQLPGLPYLDPESDQGRINGVPANGLDPNFYFYKGFGESDCLTFIKKLGFV